VSAQDGLSFAGSNNLALLFAMRHNETFQQLARQTTSILPSSMTYRLFIMKIPPIIFLRDEVTMIDVHWLDCDSRLSRVWVDVCAAQ